MYKTTSENSVSRDRRTVVQSHANDHGLDDVFRDIGALEDRKARIIQAIKAAELHLSDLNQREANAKAKAFADNTFLPRPTWIKLQADKQAAKKIILDLTADLMTIKTELKGLEHKKDRAKVGTFDAQFRKMAKRLLVPEIYERVYTATLHAMFEERQE